MAWQFAPGRNFRASPIGKTFQQDAEAKTALYFQVNNNTQIGISKN
jgi:hypothetical protein